MKKGLGSEWEVREQMVDSSGRMEKWQLHLLPQGLRFNALQGLDRNPSPREAQEVYTPWKKG